MGEKYLAWQGIVLVRKARVSHRIKVQRRQRSPRRRESRCEARRRGLGRPRRRLRDKAGRRGAERDGGPRLLLSRFLPSPFFGACRRIGRLRENNFRVDKFDEKDTEETVGVGTPCVLDAPPRGRGC